MILILGRSFVETNKYLLSRFQQGVFQYQLNLNVIIYNLAWDVFIEVK